MVTTVPLTNLRPVHNSFTGPRLTLWLWMNTPLRFKASVFLVSTYVVCERLSVMHKQVSGWTVHFCPNSPESPFLEFQTRKPPPSIIGKLQIWDDQSLLQNNSPISENFRFEMTKVYSEIPTPPPFRKTSDLRWPKFTPKYPPPISENCRFEMTKVYSEIPPISENFRFEMTKVYSEIPPPPIISENFRFEITKVYSAIPPLLISENPGDRMWRLICNPQGYHSLVCWRYSLLENSRKISGKGKKGLRLGWIHGPET